MEKSPCIEVPLSYGIGQPASKVLYPQNCPGVWTSFQYGLLQKDIATLEAGRLAYMKALVSAAGQLLPKSKEPRSYPRVAHTRRQKSPEFQKEQRKIKAAEKTSAEEPKELPPDRW